MDDGIFSVKLHASGVSLEDSDDLDSIASSKIERAHSASAVAIGSKKSNDGSRKQRLTTTNYGSSHKTIPNLDELKSFYETSRKNIVTQSSKNRVWDDQKQVEESNFFESPFQTDSSKNVNSRNLIPKSELKIIPPSPKSESKLMFNRPPERQQKGIVSSYEAKTGNLFEANVSKPNSNLVQNDIMNGDSKHLPISRMVNESKQIDFSFAKDLSPSNPANLTTLSGSQKGSQNNLKSQRFEMAPKMMQSSFTSEITMSSEYHTKAHSEAPNAVNLSPLPLVPISLKSSAENNKLKTASPVAVIATPTSTSCGPNRTNMVTSSTQKSPPYEPVPVSMFSKARKLFPSLAQDTIEETKTESKSYDNNSLRSSPSSKIDRLFPTLTMNVIEPILNTDDHKMAISVSNATTTTTTATALMTPTHDNKISSALKKSLSSNVTIKVPVTSQQKFSKDVTSSKIFTNPKTHILQISTDLKMIEDKNSDVSIYEPTTSHHIKKGGIRKSMRKSHRKSVNIAAINRPIERLEYLLGHGTGEKSENVQWYEADASSFYQPTPGEPISVAMNVSVLNLADIDTAKMSYRMKLEIWVAWPLTEAEVKSYYENPDDWKPYIHPEPVPSTITIERTEKMKFLSGRTTQLFLWRGKFVACECTLVTATYLEYMELVNFPFDCQHFHFKIGIRSDCDIPLKVVNDKVILTNLHAIGGFSSLDGRAMTQVNFDENACYFNVKSHMLTLKDFTLEGIECEIENSGDTNDTPFFHCALRMSRNYAFYVFRIFMPIFLIMVSSTLVFRFAALILDARLSYIVINMLTIVAFFFIISSILPLIPYLTFIDKYMNMALLYIVAVGVICVIFSEFSLENTRTEDAVFATCLVFLLISHLLMGVFCMHIRRVEFFKTTINRHQVDEMENSRILNAWCTQEKVDKGEEFIVHTDLHPYDGDYNVYEGCERVNEIADSSVSKLGWLFDEVEDDDDYRKEIQESSYSVKESAKTVSDRMKNEYFENISDQDITNNHFKNKTNFKSKDYASSSSSAAALQNVFDSEGPVDFHQMSELEEGLSPINSNKIKSNTHRPNSKNGKKEFQRKSSLLAKLLHTDSNVSGITGFTASPRPTSAGSSSSHGSKSKNKRKSILKNFNFRERRKKSVIRDSIVTEYLADDK